MYCVDIKKGVDHMGKLGDMFNDLESGFKPLIGYILE
jgi:hypothetical protein